MRSILITTTAVAALVATTPAFAQEAADGATDDNAIIVTARKREENLIDVPVPVTVTTSAQIKRDQIYTVTDLQRVTPALEVSQTSGGEVNGGARLRGLGTGVFNASVSPSVAFVVDQVPQGNLTFPILFDIGQVEVLRGPQGTLFGQGASAGVVNISTVAPSTSGVAVSGSVDFADKGTAGSEVGETTVRGAFNLPLGDQAAIRFATHYKRELGLQRNTALGLDNDIRELGLRLSALIEPSDSVKIKLSGEYSRIRSRGWNFFAIAIAPNGTTPTDPDGPGPAPTLPISTYSTNAFTGAPCNIPKITARAEFYCEDTQTNMTNTAAGMSAVIDVDLSDALSLTSVTSYRESDRETVTVNFSRRLDVAARSENIEDEAQQFTQELRLGYHSDSVDLVFGGLYSSYRVESTPINNALGFGNPLLGRRTGFGVCFNTGVPPLVFLPACPGVPISFGYAKTTNSTKAVFADVTFSITEQLDLFGGLRYSNYDNTTGVGVDVNYATRTQSISDNDLSGRVGLSFKPNADTTLFASYARGYKPPAIVVPTIATSPVTVLAPEKADAFEVGAKFQVGRLQLSANAFYTKVNNFQTQSQNFNTAGALVSVTGNISNVTSKGFELGVFGRVSDALTFNAGYQYNDVRFPKGFLGNDADPVQAAKLGGSQFLNAPKHKFTFSGEFVQPVGDNVELFANTNVVWKSSVLLAQNGDPRYRYPGHALINLGFGFREPDGKWSLSVFARNLTKQREPTAYLASDFSGTGDGGIRAWPAAGITARVVGVSASFNF